MGNPVHSRGAGKHLRTCLQATLVIKSCLTLLSHLQALRESLLPSLRCSLNSQLSSEGSGKEPGCGPHFPSKLSVQTPTTPRFSPASGRPRPGGVFLLRNRRSSLRRRAAENDVGTLTRRRRRTGQAEDHVSMVPPETREARTPAAHLATTDRKHCVVRMGGGGERINLSHEFSNQPDPEGPAAAQESPSPHAPKRAVSAATKLLWCCPVFQTPSTQRLLW